MAKFDSGHYVVIAKGIAACPEEIRKTVRDAFVRTLTERSAVFDVVQFDKAIASAAWNQAGDFDPVRGGMKFSIDRGADAGVQDEPQPDQGKSNLRNVP